ncbi:zinc finger protein Xfin-like isoform X2 [Macrobrachium nipponense]
MALRCPQCKRMCLQMAFYEEHQKVHALQKAETEAVMDTGYATVNAACDTFVDIRTKKTDFPATATEPQRTERDPLTVDLEEIAAQPEEQAASVAAAAAVPVANVSPDVEIIDVVDITCDDDESFHCVHCEKRFFSHSLYLTHLFSHSEQQQCRQCKENFSNAGDLEVHMIEHSLLEKQAVHRFNRCTKCNAAFFSQKVFVQHHANAHIKNLLRCQVCEEEFSRISRFQYHVLKHVGQTMYVCYEKCGLVFGDKASLKKHTSFHKASSSSKTGEVSVHQCFDCAVCYFDNLSVLEHRHKSHKAQKPYHCEKCDEVYFVEKLYKSHSCFTEQV